MLELPRRSHAAYADRQDLAASRPTLTSATVGGSLIGGDGILSGVIGGVPVTSAEEGPTARSISSS